MDAKLRSTIAKIQQEREKGNHPRALKRIDDAFKKYSGEIELHREAVDASIEAGESMRAIERLKQAIRHFPGETDGLVDVARERSSLLNDVVVGKFLIEHFIRRRELLAALDTARVYQDRGMRDLLQRAHMKRHSLASAAHGGHTVSDELMTNMLSEIVLCARLDRIDDIHDVACEILNSHPEEADALDAFLDGIGEAGANSSAVLLVSARCAIIARRLNDAVDKLVRAVEINVDYGSEVLDLLRDSGGEFDETPESVANAVIEVLLITGAHDRATELIRARLEANPASAGVLVGRVRRRLPSEGEVLALHEVFLDAAVEADRMMDVRDVIRSLGSNPDNREKLLEWLDESVKSRFLSAEVMWLHAEFALEEKDDDTALRILRALAGDAETQPAQIIELLEKHKDRHEGLDALRAELSAPPPPPVTEDDDLSLDGAAESPTVGTSSEAPAIEHFESKEFRFSGGATTPSDIVVNHEEKPRAELKPAPGDGGMDGFNIYDGNNVLGSASTGNGDAKPISSTPLGERRPLDTQKAGIIWDEEGDDDAPRTAPENAVAAPKSAAEIERPASSAGSMSEPIDEVHVANVANSLHQSGARTFFHVEEDAPAATPDTTADEPADTPGVAPPADEEATAPKVDAEPEAQPEVDTDLEIDTEPEPEAKVKAEPEPEEDSIVEPDGEPEFSFEESYARFQDGKLDAEAVAPLMEHAVEHHLVDELERLVEDAPAYDAHEARRGLCEVEYHLMTSHPGSALDVLKSLRVADLTEEQRKATWIKTVECQRMMRDFNAAHLTLAELVKLYPDCPEVEALARVNYREYLEDQCNDAPVLEKVSSLDPDS